MADQCTFGSWWLKNADFWLSKSIFYVKNYPNLSKIFFIEEYQIKGIFFVIDIFWKLQFLKRFVTKIMPFFQSPTAKHTLIYQIFFLWRSAIYHSIMLPFDAEVAEKFLIGMYLLISHHVHLFNSSKDIIIIKSKLLVCAHVCRCGNLCANNINFLLNFQTHLCWQNYRRM